MTALPPAVFPGGSGASASGTDLRPKYLQCMRGATPGVPEAGLIPWLCLSCCCAHYQRPRQLAFGLTGAQKRAAPSAQHNLGLLLVVLPELW